MKAITILIFTFLTFVVYSQTEPYTPDIRNVKWGMSKEQVKKYENIIDIIKENRDLIMSKTTISIYTCTIKYQFIKNKLRDVYVLFDVEFTSKNFNPIIYENIKKYITQKYGKPKSDYIFLNSHEYNIKTIGLLLSKNKVYYNCSWKFNKNRGENDTEIILKMVGDKNEKIRIVIYFDDGSSEKENMKNFKPMTLKNDI